MHRASPLCSSPWPGFILGYFARGARFCHFHFQRQLETATLYISLHAVFSAILTGFLHGQQLLITMQLLIATERDCHDECNGTLRRRMIFQVTHIPPRQAFSSALRGDYYFIVSKIDGFLCERRYAISFLSQRNSAIQFSRQ